MTVLFFSRKSIFSRKTFGGAESSIYLLAQELSKRRINVLYVTNEKLSNNNFDHNEYFNYCKIPYIKGRERNFLFRWISDFIFSFFAGIIITKYKVNIVYNSYDIQSNLSFLMLSKFLNFKIVLRMAGLKWYEESLKSSKKKKLYLKIFNSVDCVNFIHEELFKLFNESLNSLETKVALNDILFGDIGVEENPYKYSPTGKDFNITMVSRFSKYQKRQDLLIYSVAKIIKDNPIHLTLVGEGSNKDKLIELTQKLKIQDKINFIPFLEQNKLWEFLSSQDLLVHCCDYEGLGKVIIEAMSIGVPVLASDVTPLNSLIKDEENGFLVKNELDLWAKKLEYVFLHSDQLKIVSSKALEYFRENYSSKVNVIQFEEKFRTIITDA
ncbi:glycosyltransferase [Arthrospiribacter ruber]|uniref:Glycosyltransferase n=1 Tax=Arthrospiribacter ruber TaxID=2487934 RepID=A0A951M6C0_9BACT|nr:glycosyltransferase [Arthrospiribacter ruber]MBW3466406.1 glycosyltransferase [Arthrospiribacter ruber]